jgi:hypothetical protein
MNYTYARFHLEGYEVSTAGDSRYSALVARLPDGRTIEEAYQLDVKGYRAQGNDWRLGKGKRALDPKTDLWAEYLKLWWLWAHANPDKLEALRLLAGEHRGVLTDRFAVSPISQARALAHILNETEV